MPNIRQLWLCETHRAIKASQRYHLCFPQRYNLCFQQATYYCLLPFIILIINKSLFSFVLFLLFKLSLLGFKFDQWCFASRFIPNFLNAVAAIAARFFNRSWRYLARIERHVDFADNVWIERIDWVFLRCLVLVKKMRSKIDLKNESEIYVVWTNSNIILCCSEFGDYHRFRCVLAVAVIRIDYRKGQRQWR